MDFENLPNVVAIVGSREFPEEKKSWIRKFIRNLDEGTVVVSGGARGVDSWARTYSLDLGHVHYKEFPVEPFEWQIFGKSSGHLRNDHIVKYVKDHNGIVVIFYTIQNGTITPGSTDVIQRCLKQGVPTILISEGGELKGTYLKHN